MRQTLVLILTLVALCSAQQRDVNYTGNFPNGRFWNTSSDAEKLHYLVAVRDATILAEEKGTWWANGFTAGDYEKELDTVYKEGENVNIPIIWTFRYCTNKLRGEMPKENLEKALMNLRRMALDIFTK